MLSTQVNGPATLKKLERAADELYKELAKRRLLLYVDDTGKISLELAVDVEDREWPMFFVTKLFKPERERRIDE